MGKINKKTLDNEPFQYAPPSNNHWFIGLDDNNPIYIDLSEEHNIPHYVGTMGSGKTVSSTYSLGNFLKAYPNTAVTIIDLLKGGSDFAKFENNFLSIINNIENSKNYFNFLYCEMIKRKNSPNLNYDPIITIIESAHTLMRNFENSLNFNNSNKQFNQKDLLIIKKLAKESYKYKIYFVLCSQIYNEELSKTFSLYNLAFKVTKQESYALIDSEIASTLNTYNRGCCYNKNHTLLKFPFYTEASYITNLTKNNQCNLAVMTAILFTYNFDLNKIATDQALGFPMIPEIHVVDDTNETMLELADILNQIVIKKTE